MQLKEARSLLFVPATAGAMLEKAAQRGADAVVIDLEDGVAADRKQEARGLAAAAIVRLAGSTPLVVRVNATPELLRGDLAALPLARLHGVMLPKVEAPAQIDMVAAALAAAAGPQAPPIAALVETPRGVLQAEGFASHPALCALGFGAEDFAAEMLVEPEPEALSWAAQKVATCARAYGLAAWGLPGSVAEIDDMERFARLAQLARRQAFTGTVCIHPRQVPVVNAAFSPTAQQLHWARQVVAADETARAQGRGAVRVEGRMVDRPIVERARRWLRMTRA